MPLYDYECTACGPFTEFGSMAAFAAPQACPTCGAASGRNLMASPSLKPEPVSTATALRRAGITPSRHPAACGCCTPARPRLRADAAGTA
jgi:putative FmdB family regulatory protein